MQRAASQAKLGFLAGCTGIYDGRGSENLPTIPSAPHLLPTPNFAWKLPSAPLPQKTFSQCGWGRGHLQSLAHKNKFLRLGCTCPTCNASAMERPCKHSTASEPYCDARYQRYPSKRSQCNTGAKWQKDLSEILRPHATGGRFSVIRDMRSE